MIRLATIRSLLFRVARAAHPSNAAYATLRRMRATTRRPAARSARARRHVDSQVTNARFRCRCRIARTCRSHLTIFSRQRSASISDAYRRRSEPSRHSENASARSRRANLPTARDTSRRARRRSTAASFHPANAENIRRCVIRAATILNSRRRARRSRHSASHAVNAARVSRCARATRYRSARRTLAFQAVSSRRRAASASRAAASRS